MANERFVIVQGPHTGDKSRVVALNGSSLYLWQTLQGKDFSQEEVIRLLTEKYNVSEAQASQDAASWIAKLIEYNLAK